MTYTNEDEVDKVSCVSRNKHFLFERDFIRRSLTAVFMQQFKFLELYLKPQILSEFNVNWTNDDRIITRLIVNLSLTILNLRLAHEVHVLIRAADDVLISISVQF